MPTTLDFRSDTVTRPTPAMRLAMAQAEVGDDVFGDDPTVAQLQTEAAQSLGFEASLYVSSGTQANLIALMTQCARGEEAIVGQQSHAYRWESGGMAVLGSIQPQPLENQADGTLDLDLVAATIKPDDPHFARTRLLALENTMGGKVLPIPYLQAAGDLCRHYGLIAHLDGARLMNAAVACTQTTDVAGTPSAEQILRSARAICAPFDSVSLCLSKGLGAPIGSLLLGSQEMIARAIRVRKMLGGGMRQVGLLAAAGRHALAHHLTRLADDHANAARLAQGFRELNNGTSPLAGQLSVEGAHTNMVFVTVASTIAARLQQHLAACGVLCSGAALVDGRARQRWVTHLDADAKAVDEALDRLATFKLGAPLSP